MRAAEGGSSTPRDESRHLPQRRQEGLGADRQGASRRQGSCCRKDLGSHCERRTRFSSGILQREITNIFYILFLNASLTRGFLMRFGTRTLLATSALMLVMATAAHSKPMNFVGDWSNAAKYSVGQVVQYNGGLFYALKSTRSAPNVNFIPSNNPTWWVPVGTIGNTLLHGIGNPHIPEPWPGRGFLYQHRDQHDLWT